MNYSNTNGIQSATQHPILKSIGAMSAGYVAGILIVLIWSLAMGDASQYLGLALIITGWYMGVVSLPCWAITVLPIWLYLPRDSILWRRWPATLIGAGIGALAITITIVLLNLFQLRSNYSGLVALLPIAAAMGAVTGFVSAWLHRR